MIEPLEGKIAKESEKGLHHSALSSAVSRSRLTSHTAVNPVVTLSADLAVVLIPLKAPSC
jgi:hypothetical protein